MYHNGTQNETIIYHAAIRIWCAHPLNISFLPRLKSRLPEVTNQNDGSVLRIL